MIRCSKCVMPNTRPDTPFVDGVCQACINYANRPQVDWTARRAALAELLDRHHGECIVPSSGGKDSTYQAITLKKMGAHVTAVTARTCHLTAIGRANIDNLARHVRTIEVVPNMTVRAKLNRIGLEMVGDISWPEHVSIFTTPFKVAAQLDIPLIFYGENPQGEYGGPLGTEQALTMTRRWVSEFGGFLGLRPQDLIGQHGLTERDMQDYTPPTKMQMLTAGVNGPLQSATLGVEAHFLGAYLPWDSHENAKVAADAGMIYQRPISSNWWEWENQDNAQCAAHDLFAYLKYGYTRGQAQISVDIRAGLVGRGAATQWLRYHPQLFPHQYSGVPFADVLDRLGTSREWFAGQIKKWANWELFDDKLDFCGGLPAMRHSG